MMLVIIIIETILYINNARALVNLARGKTVMEDKPWQGVEKWKGDNAVDGHYENRSAQGGQCVISSNLQREATWMVDLGGVVSISYIDVHYRTDNKPRPTSYTSRMAGFFLYVSNTTSKGDGHLCFHEIQTLEGTPSEDQRINCTVHGRYVIYYNERKIGVMYPKYYSTYAFYELCELEVYGCGNIRFYGPYCGIPCPRNCQERRCDANTGKCLSCVPGYHDFYCTKPCPINCQDKSCDVNTGHCRGCVPGYRGQTCGQECRDGYFGPNCTGKCGYCMNTNQCHHVHGTCSNGCFAGYMGKFCKEKCPVGSFGLECHYKCNAHCSGNGSCNHVTGICETGCKNGWIGHFCDKEQKQSMLSTFNLVTICIGVSVLTVLTGCLLNCVYWKRKSAEKMQEREVRQNVETKTHEESEENFELYVNLREDAASVSYEEMNVYSN